VLVWLRTLLFLGTGQFCGSKRGVPQPLSAALAQRSWARDCVKRDPNGAAAFSLLASTPRVALLVLHISFDSFSAACESEYSSPRRLENAYAAPLWRLSILSKIDAVSCGSRLLVSLGLQRQLQSLVAGYVIGCLNTIVYNCIQRLYTII